MNDLLKCREDFRVLFGWLIIKAKEFGNDKASEEIQIPDIDISLVADLLYPSEKYKLIYIYIV